jgi:hypothetical protein
MWVKTTDGWANLSKANEIYYRETANVTQKSGWYMLFDNENVSFRISDEDAAKILAYVELNRLK